MIPCVEGLGWSAGGLSLTGCVLAGRRCEDVGFVALDVVHKVGGKGKGSLGGDRKIACRFWGDVG